MSSEVSFSNMKQISISCNVCDMRFRSVQALRIHKNSIHPSDPQIEHSSESFESAPNAPKNTPIAVPLSRTSKRLQMRRNGAKDTEQSENSDHSTEEQHIRVQFACPKCNKVFLTNFQALKHIEKKHPEDTMGTGSPGGSKLKPLQIETLLNDTNNLESSYNMSPLDVTLIQSNWMYCLDCEKQFQTVSAFNKHAFDLHRDEVDSMFFKNVEEFYKWKKLMETQVKMKYLALTKSTSQTYYQCNYVSPKNEHNKTYLCPSIILVKELQNGTQMHYSKKHYGHICSEYQLPEEFYHLLTNKKDESNSVFDQLINKKADNEMMEKFQNLMSNIAKEAMKLNSLDLRKLFNSALQMQGLLNSFDEVHSDNDAPQINKSMTDDQITNALEGKRTSARLKRKSETRASVDAKIKKDIKSDTPEDTNKIGTKENKKMESPNLTARSSPLLSPSFVDTFKQFIGEPTLETTNKSKNVKKEVVKTKIGQFSPKNKSQEVIEDKKKKHHIKDKKKNQKDFEEIPEKTKRNILKPSKTNTSFSLGNGIKYEVKEQENDCNILILKM